MALPKLYALGLKSQYLHDKAAANIGRKLIQQEAKVINKVSMSTALAILIAGKITKRMYIDIRLLLKNDGHDILPVYDKLNEYRKEKRPPLEKLQDPYKGIKVDYKKALEKYAYLLLKTINLSKLENFSV